MWHMTCDMWHVTRGMKYVSRDIWYLTSDMWGEVKHLKKFQLPSSYGFGIKVCSQYLHKESVSDVIIEWVTEVFVEQPRQHRAS